MGLVEGTIGRLHQRFVFVRRARILADCLAKLIPPRSRVLDVGCGDGAIDCLITTLRPDVSIEGIDPLVRPNRQMPVRPFDGITIPHANQSFDVVMFIDVLHHTDDPQSLLREAARVGRVVLIKDHVREGLLAQNTLRVMDWVGNAHHGVVLPYNYWSRMQWKKAFTHVGLVLECEMSPSLYPLPFSWIFGRRLHFVAKLVVS